MRKIMTGVSAAVVVTIYAAITPAAAAQAAVSRPAPAEAASASPALDAFLAKAGQSHQETVAAVSYPLSYTIRAGDTLSSIAAKAYGSASKWPALWWVNRGTVHNPNLITAGQRITLSRWHPDSVWLDAQAMAAIPKPVVRVQVVSVHVAPQAAPAPAVSDDQDGVQPQAAPQPAAQPAYQAPAQVSTAGMGGFQSCVIQRESGGNSQVMNGTGHYGLYQFSYSTWVGHGGSPSAFGHASVGEQNQVFANTYAADGTSDWAPYDGC